MKAIYHKWPDNPDSSDEKMIVLENKCIGCGVCAHHCPENAIHLERTGLRDVFIPLKKIKVD